MFCFSKSIQALACLNVLYNKRSLFLRFTSKITIIAEQSAK